MQQRGVLRHHGDLRAQALLRHRGDVLAVDQDAAAFEVEEAQQQIDQRSTCRRRSGRPGRSSRPARTVSVELVDQRRSRGRSRSARPRSAISPRGHRRAPCASGRSVSVIGRAMVIMPSCTTPMFSKMSVTCQRHPAGDVDDLPGQRQRHRDGADRDLAVRSTAQIAERAGAGHQHGVERREAEAEQRVEPQRARGTARCARRSPRAHRRPRRGRARTA